jgi:hypothetical protein
VPQQVQRGVPTARAAGSLPLSVLVNSSSDEEENDRERTTYDRWDPATPPSPRVEGVAAKSTLEIGAWPPIAGLSVEVPAGAPEAPVGAAEAPVGAVEAPPNLREKGSGVSPS